MPALDTRRSSLPSSRRRRTGAALLATVVAVSAVGAGTLAPPPALAASAADLDLSGGDSTLLTSSSQTLAPGLELTDFRRLQPAGWVTGHVMRADLTTPTLSLDVLDAGSVTGGATLSDQIAGTGAVAAVNGDYFDMNNSTAPVGTNISPSQGVRTLAPDTRPAFTIADGLAAVQALTSAATVTIDGTTHDVTGVNSPTIGTGGIGWYTPAWGTHTLARPLGAPATVVTPMTKVTVEGGVVTQVSTDPASVDGDAAIAEGTGVLIGREAGAATLAMLEVGDTVDVTVSASADVDLAVSGSQRLIIDGEQTDADQVEASRTAIGVNRDGTEITVVTIDGRAGDSRGMTLHELGDLMLDLNVHNAVNLDGGGSTMLAVREPGETDASIHNRPSDGSERVVANSLAFFSTAETGVVSDVRVAPALDVTDADAVFPGLQRTVSGTGVDDNLTGVAVAGSFSASTDAAVRVASSTEASAQLEGLTPGTATVSFTAEGKTASTQLRVLGELERIRPSATVVALSEPGHTATVRLTGLDADGFSAPIETGDVTVEHGADVTVEATGLDEFIVAPVVDSGSATVTFTAGGRSVDVAVTVGYRTIGIADFADAAEWTAGVARATGTLTPATGPEGQPALTMSYDFTTSTGTRGYYAIVPGEAATGGRVLEGQPQALTLWMHGDGSGAWPRLQLKTGVGTTINLDGPMVDWTGWRQARFTVPAGTAYPLTFQRVRMMETRPAASYQGEITIASLESVVAPDVDQPVATRVFDPVIVADGSVDDRAQRIAVMNDAQFVARNPDSDLVQATRETLREIVAAEPDYLVINGDLVDEASVADFELAARILEEEVGDRIPYVYVPGNHEIMGGAISNFIDAFGDPYRSVDLGGTRMITLNSAAGSFRASGLDQLRFLEERLDDAAADPTVTGVLVFSHHPVDDPLPTKASQLSDRTEAAQFVETLTGFRAETGKSAAMVNGHVGVFDGTSYEGVSRVLGGNAGKGPSGTPDAGGFTGWTMLGVNPGAGVVGSSPEVVADRIRWMQAETKPRVESVTLQAPSVMEVGETAAVSASLMQDGARVVPVTWPVSAEWGGEGVDVVGASGVDATARGLTSGLEAAAAGALRVNPATGEVTAVAPGEASLSVTVNGVTETVAVSVVGEEPGEPEEPGEGSGEEPGEGENPTPAPTPTPTPTDSASPAPAPGNGGTDVGDTGAGDAAGGLSSEDPLAVTGADVDPALWAAALGLLLVAGGIGARLWYLRRPDRGTV